MHFALALATTFVFVLTLGVYVRPTLVFSQETAPAAKTNVQLTIDPSPAHKGTNVIQVKLSDPTGQPVKEANVTVTFYMPAMPSMSVAEMRTVVKATDKGDGTYEGKGDLTSGDTWQVTIIARKGGKIIATKKVAIKATGGM